MIQEFSIENTLSIKDRQTISFEALGGGDDDVHLIQAGNKRLLKLAALYGANGSGKTNILVAFSVLMKFILNSVSAIKPAEKIGVIPFLFDDDYVSRPSSFEIVFYIEDIQYTYSINLDKNCVQKESLSYKPKNKKNTLYERQLKGSIYEYRWGEDLPRDKLKLSKITRPNATFLNTAAQFELPEIQKIYRFLYGLSFQLIQPQSKDSYRKETVALIETDKQAKSKILDLLNKADLAKIDDIVIEHLDLNLKEGSLGGRRFQSDFSRFSTVYISHNYGKNFQLPLHMESNGTQRLFDISTPLIKSLHESKFLCIDEIEASLHDDLIEYYIKSFLTNSVNSQMIFTTHNQNLLDSELLRNDEIWFAEKGGDGGSKFYSLAEFKGLKKGVSRRELYKAGRFGALPLTGTFSKES
jgi:AAA15 family ATPase/GTPase